MVQTDWANQPPLTGVPVPTSPEVTSVGEQIGQGKDYVSFFNGRRQCEAFNLFEAGADRTVADLACNPATFVPTPAGEFTGFARLQQLNNIAIKSTGAIPVLLTWGDYDSIAPPETPAADLKYWVDNCPGYDGRPTR